MRLKNILLVVEDIEKSVAFYKELFGLAVTLSREGNVMMTEGLVLQDRKIWEDTVAQNVICKNHATELYFVEYDIEAFVNKINIYKEPITIITPLTEDSYGKKIVRLYDPDGHVIEVSTP